MQADPLLLSKFLVEAGLLSRADAEKALAEAAGDERKMSEQLVSQGKISEDELRRVRAYVIGIPFVSLAREKIDYSILSLIPEPIARRHNIVAYRKTADSLEVAMLEPDDLAAIDFIKKSVGLKILPRLTDTASIKHALLQYQKSLKQEFGDLIKTDSETMTQASSPEASEGELKKLAEDLPVVRIVETLLSHAALEKASDIHIEPYEKELVIRYRIDGLLHDAMILPKTAAPGISARIKVLSGLRLDEKRLPQDGRFKIEHEGTHISFRVSTLPTYYGEKIVMRLLPDTATGRSLESMGFHGEGLERIHEGLKASTGMILATGPTGSGKTTTLYSMLDILNTPDVNISTVEDPIEYQVARINQTQVKPEIGLTFAAGLRSLVRQDPDIIMVGEIRDKETIGLAVNAALTGHLVLSTLHTNSAAGAIPRMLDMGAEPFLLVSTINLIIGQRLVRRLTKDKEAHKLSKSELAALKEKVDLDKVLKDLKEEKIVKPDETWSEIKFYRPVPSKNNEDGYEGRVGIHEVLRMSPAIKELIMKNATADQLEAEARRSGMLTMLEDGIFKAVQGVTTIEEVLRVVTE